MLTADAAELTVDPAALVTEVSEAPEEAAPVLGADDAGDGDVGEGPGSVSAETAELTPGSEED